MPLPGIMQNASAAAAVAHLLPVTRMAMATMVLMAKGVTVMMSSLVVTSKAEMPVQRLMLAV